MNALTQYLTLYNEHKALIDANAPSVLNAPRQEAYACLSSLDGMPKKGDEGFVALSLNDMFLPDYGININRVPFGADVASTFKCGVPNVSTLLAIVANDTFIPSAALERNLPDGVVVMSLAKAARLMPEVVEKYYDKLAGAQRLQPTEPHSSSAAKMPPTAVSRLNALFAQDGVFVRVKSGVRLQKPLQIVNIFNATAPLLAPRRALIVIEDGASASVLICDHSANASVSYLDCQVTEIFLGNGSKLEYYELEESSEKTSRVTELYSRQDEGSELVVNGTTLLGGVTRNAYYVDMCGQHASAKIAAMAVGGDKQIIDSATCVVHHEPKCHSDQMFKYILDDSAVGSFYGSILVDEKAEFTKAYQSNRNILASGQARMHTRPQLEIYCDEVKCSHGATVGQLDQNALFYMRQRGIPEHQAKMMLMQAFMADVIDTVSIPSLQSRLRQLIELRLAGSRELCAACEQSH